MPILSHIQAATRRSAVPTLYEIPGSTDAFSGYVSLSWPKVLWVGGMYIGAIVGGAATFTPAAFFLFAIFSVVTLCLGHSLGMHRRFIHRSYACPKALEYFFVYCGVLVGLAGPFGMMRTHDTRDWAQRQARCHDYFAHRRRFLLDGLWQMFCDVHLKCPPIFIAEADVANDRFYRFLERTWMLQQLPWVALLWLCGGLPWVIWGVCVRVAVCVTGHWLIGYFAHNRGPRTWHVEGAGVQGYNVRFCGLITMGECWHNNHHAFPASAKLGLHRGQVDPGWWVLMLLQHFHLAWNIKEPVDLAPRPELRRIALTQGETWQRVQASATYRELKKNGGGHGAVEGS